MGRDGVVVMNGYIIFKSVLYIIMMEGRDANTSLEYIILLGSGLVWRSIVGYIIRFIIFLGRREGVIYR